MYQYLFKQTMHHHTKEIVALFICIFLKLFLIVFDTFKNPKIKLKNLKSYEERPLRIKKMRT